MLSASPPSFAAHYQDLVASGIACIARDYRGQFAVELASFVASCLGTVLYARLGLRRRDR